MIASLNGTIKAIATDHIVIDVGGVGYKVNATERTITNLDGVGANVELFTHHYIREDAMELFGFESKEEMALFESLLSISGVGPRLALSILSATSPHEVKQSIINEDVLALTKVSGVGKKTAERIVLELKGKIGKDDTNLTVDETGRGQSTGSGDAIDALVSLGYAPAEARAAMQEVAADVSDTGEQVREALKHLGK